MLSQQGELRSDIGFRWARDDCPRIRAGQQPGRDTGNGLNNIITGGSGNDTLSGGGGNDHFVFNFGDVAGDLSTDFTANAAQTDHIDFYGYTGDHLSKGGTAYQIQDSSNNVVGSLTLGNSDNLTAANYTFH